MRLTVLLFLPSVALAAPLELNHQGRLLATDGTALEGAHTLDLALYDAPAGGTPLWGESHAVELDAGYFSVALGSVTALDDALFDGGNLYLALSVDGGAELPDRLPIVSVPYAIRARTAVSVVGGAVDATSLKVNGVEIVDASGNIVGGLPPDTLGSLSCDTDEIAVYDGSAWACGAAQAHAHDADDIATGTLDVARLPIGTSVDTVAAGAHGHDAADVSSGTLEVARLPVGTSSGTVAAGDHEHDTFSGNVTLADDSASCGSGNEGALRYASLVKEVQYCNGSAWVSLASSLGLLKSNPGDNCAHILSRVGAADDGLYWIDPDKSGAFQVWCDMTTDGGGWTLIARAVPGTQGHQSASDVRLDALKDPTGGTSGTMGDAKRQAIGRFYRFQCGGTGPLYAYLRDTSRTVVVYWGADQSTLSWNGGSYSASPSAYGGNNSPDCGGAECAGPGYAGRNWMRTTQNGCGFGGYGQAGTWWAK